VRQLQGLLSDLGYLCGSVDGLYGGQTEFAVASLQLNMQLEPTGQADPALQLLMTKGQAKPAAPLISAGMLQKGDRGEQVHMLEKRLRSLSYLKASPDDLFDEVTARAVTTLQALNGLPPTGTVGPAEINLIYRVGVIASDPVLTLNDTGYEVKQLQARLAELNFYTGPLDGIYSTAFEAVVKVFQTQTKLEVDGKAGFYTQSTAYAVDAPFKTGTGPASSPAPTAAPTAKPTAAPTPAPTTQPTATPTPTVKPTAAPTPAPTTQPTATPTPTVKPTAAPTPVVLKDGSTSKTVVSLEVRLIELGYHLALADDRYTSLTSSSIKAFQKRAGLGITGIADLTTQQRLAASTAPRTSQSYRRGSYGDAVKRIQQRLIALGHLGGQADGRFGPVTETAARAFQKKYGLAVDGVIGPRSLARLYYSDTGAPPLNGGSGSSVTPVADSPTQPTDDILTAPTLAASLRRGSRGTVVKQVQMRLIQLGYLPTGSADGSFGPMTEKAVLAYQKKAGLEVDGIVGRLTIASLYSASAPHA
jgi:peptidoglycan hydrolase-like protein with peptidoglycan-binding domain